MEADWKPKVEQEAEGLVDKLKELNASEKWVANGDKPCALFKMEVDSRMASKGVATIEYPLEQVVKFFKDPTTSKKINEMLVKMELLYEDQEKSLKVVHMEYKATWPVSNRDFVSVSIRQEGEGAYYIASRSCSYPQAEVKDVVRAELFIGGYIFEKVDEKSTKVTYISNSDAKGNVPGMLKNTAAVKQGEVVSKIAAAMKKDGY